MNNVATNEIGYLRAVLLSGSILTTSVPSLLFASSINYDLNFNNSISNYFDDFTNTINGATNTFEQEINNISVILEQKQDSMPLIQLKNQSELLEEMEDFLDARLGEELYQEFVANGSNGINWEDIKKEHGL